MFSLHRILATIIILNFLVVPARGADPFYESLLREGQLSHQRGDLEAALIELELACFGLLDEPTELAEGLIYLGVVQSQSGRLEDFEKTFRRILELEERFGAYTSSQVAPDIRDVFEGSTRVNVPRGYLVATPAFAHLATVPEEPEIKHTKRERKARKKAQIAQKDLEALTETASPEAAVSTSITTTDVEAIDTRPAETDASWPGPAAPDIPNTGLPLDTETTANTSKIDQAFDQSQGYEPSFNEVSFDEDALALAISVLANAKTRTDLSQAMDIARPLADDFPERSDAQHLVARIAYMGSGWEDAATYYERGGESTDPELVFYSAVSYFELGRLDEAKASLELALPKLTRTDYVNSYINKILEPQD